MSAPISEEEAYERVADLVDQIGQKNGGLVAAVCGPLASWIRTLSPEVDVLTQDRDEWRGIMSTDPAAVPRAIAEELLNEMRDIRAFVKRQPEPEASVLYERTRLFDHLAMVMGRAAERLAKASGVEVADIGAAPVWWCPQCGPDPKVDEDGLCTGCGCAVGQVPDWRTRDQRLAELERELAEAKSKTASWDDGYARAIVDTEAERDAARAEVDAYKKDWYAAKAEFGTASTKLRAEVRELREALLVDPVNLPHDEVVRGIIGLLGRTARAEADVATARREALDEAARRLSALVERASERGRNAIVVTEVFAVVEELRALATPPATEGT